MSTNSQMKRPLQNLIGGPWVLIGMALVSLASFIFAMIKRKKLMENPPVPLVELDYREMEGLWNEYAGFRKWYQQDHAAATYEFTIDKKDNVTLEHEIRFGTADGPKRKIKKKLSIPDISEPACFEIKGVFRSKIPVKIIYLNTEMGIMVLTMGKCFRPHVLSREWPINEEVYSELTKRMKEESAVDLKGLEIFQAPEEME